MARTTTYEEVYERFLSKIEDPELASLDEDSYSDSMKRWLHSALATMELNGVRLKNDYVLVNDASEVFRNQLDNIEIEIIALFMVCAWYDAKINSVEHILLFVGANGEKWTDQVNHLNALKQTRNDYFILATHAVRNYNYKNNGYYF